VLVSLVVGAIECYCKWRWWRSAARDAALPSLECERMHRRRLETSTRDREALVGEMPQQRLGGRTAGGVVRAEKEPTRLLVHGGLRRHPSAATNSSTRLRISSRIARTLSTG
jgi:hypothetical protein